MKNNNLKIESVKRYLKRSLKGKVRITMSLICIFLLSNAVKAETTDTQQKLNELEQTVNELKAKVLGESIIFGKNAEDKSNDQNKNSIVIGQNALNKGTRSIVIGFEAKNNPTINDNTLDISFNIILGNNSQISTSKKIEYSTIVGSEAKIESDRAIAIGHEAKVFAKSDNGVAIGQGTEVKSFGGLAFGRQSIVDTNSKGAIAIGGNDSDYRLVGNNKESGSGYPKTTAKGSAATAIGAHAQAKAKAATSIGAKAFSLGEESTAIGANALASKKRGVGIGFQANAKEESSVAIGTDATSNFADGVAIGSSSVANRNTTGTKYYDFVEDRESNTESSKLATKAAVSIGDTSKNITRQLIGLAAGKDDTDAVNVWQVKQTKKYILDNQAITYAIKDGDKNLKVIKKQDGFYKVKDNGQIEKLADNEKEKVFLAAIDEMGKVAKPMTLSNIKNTLGDNGYNVAGLITEIDAKKLSNAASIKDLQELAKAGMTFETNFGNENNPTEKTVSKKLGETLSIIATNTVDGTLKRDNGDLYTGDNLATYVKNVNGQKKIFIGMKQDAKFKSIVIGQTYGDNAKDGKGKIEDDDTALKLTHDKATISIAKVDGENGANPKAKISGLKDNDINSEDYGKADSGIAATQKEVKDVLNKTKAVQNGTSGTVVYTKKDGTRLVKDGDKWYIADDN